MGTLTIKILEFLARRFNIPVGAVLCSGLTIGGITTALTSPEYFLDPYTVIIAVGLWGFAFVLAWIVYGADFWLSPKRFDELRKNELSDGFLKNENK